MRVYISLNFKPTHWERGFKPPLRGGPGGGLKLDELGADKVYMSITPTNSQHCSEYSLNIPFDFLEFLGRIFSRDCEFVFRS